VAGVPPSPTATTLRIATAIVLLETVGIWIYIAYLTADAAGDPGGWRVIGFVAMFVVAFTALTVGLWRRRRWVRAPLIVLQLLLSVIGASLLGGDAPVTGVIIIVVSVGCVGLLLVSSTREALS
jgi:hypothetical protein